MHHIKNEGQGRVFNSPFLELFSKASPPVSFGVYLAALVGLLYVGIQQGVVDSFLQGLLIYAGGTLSWTLAEYFFHRYVFHLEDYFPDSKAVQAFTYTMHGVHHEYPRDPNRLIMPPAPGLLIISLLFGVFYLVMGSYVFLFLPGFLNGYLVYTIIHYATHRLKPPKLLKPLWRHHALHHYKYPDLAFGVSSSFWDRIFRTMPPVKKKKSIQKKEETTSVSA